MIIAPHNLLSSRGGGGGGGGQAHLAGKEQTSTSSSLPSFFSLIHQVRMQLSYANAIYEKKKKIVYLNLHFAKLIYFFQIDFFFFLYSVICLKRKINSAGHTRGALLLRI